MLGLRAFFPSKLLLRNCPHLYMYLCELGLSHASTQRCGDSEGVQRHHKNSCANIKSQRVTQRVMIQRQVMSLSVKATFDERVLDSDGWQKHADPRALLTTVHGGLGHVAAAPS